LDEIKKVSNIENIFINGMNESLLRNFNSNIEILSKGDKIVIDDNLSIDILWPDKNFYSNDENENSLVLLIKYKDKNILYTGDINKNIEEKISKNVSKTNILLVPHHGSDTSSSEDFLAKLSPEVAIFSYGHNFYGIPSLNVVDRYKKYGIESYSTFKDGEIWSIMDKDGYKVYTNKNSVNNELNLFELLFALVVIYLTLMYLEEREIYYEEI
jgi:competence protein ComEC